MISHRYEDSDQFLEDYPLVDGIRELVRVAVEPYLEPDPDAAKTGGSSTIGVTVAIDERGRVTQIYVLQKRLAIILSVDYCGSFRFKPVAELFIKPGTKVYNFDCGIVQSDLAWQAEAAAWRTVRASLSRAQQDLSLQLPIGRVPPEGLSRKQKDGLRKLVKDDPNHRMAWLLDAEPGQSFSHETAYELPFDLSFSASTALRRVQMVR